MIVNAEEVMHSLEEFSKSRPKEIPRELDDYLGYVAKTGDPVFKWSLVKSLFREKLLNVINDFYEDTLTIDLPPCPNVDTFHYDRMKSFLLERLELFHGVPFTVQRICELLTNPRKEYNRADKFMRAIEKNILVVSTREPGRYSDLDCDTNQECAINGIQEPGDTLDSSFCCNDIGSGTDSSHHFEQSNSAEDINKKEDRPLEFSEVDGKETPLELDSKDNQNSEEAVDEQFLVTSDLKSDFNGDIGTTNVSSSSISPPSEEACRGDSDMKPDVPIDVNDSSCSSETFSSNQESELFDPSQVHGEMTSSSDNCNPDVSTQSEADENELSPESNESDLNRIDSSLNSELPGDEESSETNDKEDSNLSESSNSVLVDCTSQPEEPFTSSEIVNEVESRDIGMEKGNDCVIPEESPEAIPEPVNFTSSESSDPTLSRVESVECDTSNNNETVPDDSCKRSPDSVNVEEEGEKMSCDTTVSIKEEDNSLEPEDMKVITNSEPETSSDFGHSTPEPMEIEEMQSLKPDDE